MSTETVVFFYLMEKTIGRKYPWQRTDFCVKKAEWYGRTVLAAGIPEYDFTKRPWKREILGKKICSELVPGLEIDFWENTCFMNHKALQRTLIGELLEEIFPLEHVTVPGKKGMGKITPGS